MKMYDVDSLKAGTDENVLVEVNNIQRIRRYNLHSKPLIDPGIYRFEFKQQHPPFKLGRNWCFRITLSVVGGVFDGVELNRFYNLHCDKQHQLQIPSGGSAALRRESMRILGELTTDLTVMADLPLVGRVKTVTSDRDKDPLVESEYYSVVSKLWLYSGSIIEQLEIEGGLDNE